MVGVSVLDRWLLDRPVLFGQTQNVLHEVEPTMLTGRDSTSSHARAVWEGTDVNWIGGHARAHLACGTRHLMAWAHSTPACVRSPPYVL
eukprot:6023001-Prymnesium_polylepis.2